MFSSTAFAYKKWALEQIRLIPELEGVQITNGWPGRDIEAEWIMLGRVQWSDEGWAALGARQRQEEYSISLVINTRRIGDSQEEAQERVFELLGHIEAWVRANALPASGVGARSLVVELIPRDAGTNPFDGGTEAQIEAGLSVTARI